MLLIIAIIAGIAGLYMAWNIGANDVANSMSTAVGAKAITLRQALVIASILNFLGAVLVGKHVTDTIKNKIIDVSLMSQHDVTLGFLAALLSASLFVTFSTWRELPVSTTHAIVGGVAGFGLIGGGMEMVHWDTLAQVVASWVLSPFAGAALAFFMFKVIQKLIFDVADPVARAKQLSPLFIGLTIFIILLSIFTKTRVGTELNYTMGEYILISLVMSAAAGLAGYLFFVKTRAHAKKKKYDVVEGLFRRLQVMTSCYVAFSHGANDVANAVGPVAVILAFSWQEVDTVYLLAFGGIGLALGITTWGYKVIRTVGGRITALTNTRGFSVDFAAATVVLVASKMGMPVSTSHAVVGAVIGVGLARGLDAVDLGVIKKIVYSWLLTLPATAFVSILIYRGLIILF
ncbi:MAG TPA: inorganic phosphate transporter [Thermoplasmatales archaeon]|nr:inorganic phosphate transporter [Thermoplasmatales archaeon]